MDAASRQHGFLKVGSDFLTIDHPLGVNGTVASDLNDVGQVVGWYMDGSNTHAFVANVSIGPQGIPDQTARLGTPFSAAVPADVFSDPDGDALSYDALLSSGAPLPAWLSFNPGTQTFSGTPGAGDVGNLNVSVTASDPGGLSATDTFALHVII